MGVNGVKRSIYLSEGEVVELPGDPQFLHQLFPVPLLQSLRLQLCNQHIHLHTHTHTQSNTQSASNFNITIHT